MWYTAKNTSHLLIPAHVKAWLFDSGSLTAKLKAIAEQEFEVQIYSQGWGIGKLNEYRRLCLNPQQSMWIRQVKLLCDEKPMIFARTVIPKRTLRSKCWPLHYLQNNPIIEILKKDRHLKRTEFEIAKIYQHDASAHWARRSVFYFYNCPLLLQEYFLFL